MCRGFHGVGLLDFCHDVHDGGVSVPSVIPMSSAARCSTWWPLTGQLRRSQRI